MKLVIYYGLLLLLPSHSFRNSHLQRLEKWNSLPGNLENNDPYKKNGCPNDTSNETLINIYRINEKIDPWI